MKYKKKPAAKITKPLKVGEDLLHQDRVILLIFAAALMLWIIQPRYGRLGWKSSLTIVGDIGLSGVVGFITLTLIPAYLYLKTKDPIKTKILLWVIGSQAIIMLGVFSFAKWPLGIGGLLGIIISALATAILYLNPKMQYLFYLNIVAGAVALLAGLDSGWLKIAVAGLVVQVLLIGPAQKEASSI